jgi:hypothetical protein
VDRVARHERRDGRQLAEQAHLATGQADLLFGLAQRRLFQAGVLGVAPAAGKGDLAGVTAQVCAPACEDGVRLPVGGR